MINVHLVADTVPLGTTFCQKVPKGQKIVLLHSTASQRTSLRHVHTTMVLEPLLTHEAATGQVQLVPSRGHPHSSGVGTNQAGLTLSVLRQEGYHTFHWCPGCCGNTLGGLQQRVEQTTLIKDHVV